MTSRGLKSVAGVAFLIGSTQAFAQGYDSEGNMWKIFRGGIDARCMIEVATATNEQHLLTQEKYRDATQAKAVRLAGEYRRLARELDSDFSAQERELTRLRDLLENQLIAQAEYDAVANASPDVEPLAEAMRLYPTCNFFHSTSGKSINLASKLLRR